MASEISNSGMNGNTAKYFLGGVLFGAAIGGAVALLYAPMKGEDTRKLIKEKAVSTEKVIESKAADLRDKAIAAEKTIEGKAVQLKERVGEMTADLRSKACD